MFKNCIKCGQRKEAAYNFWLVRAEPPLYNALCLDCQPRPRKVRSAAERATKKLERLANRARREYRKRHPQTAAERWEEWHDKNPQYKQVHSGLSLDRPINGASGSDFYSLAAAPVSSRPSEAIMEKLAGVSLTYREWQVVSTLAEGDSEQEAAKQLGLTQEEFIGILSKIREKVESANCL